MLSALGGVSYLDQHVSWLPNIETRAVVLLLKRFLDSLFHDSSRGNETVCKSKLKASVVSRTQQSYAQGTSRLTACLRWFFIGRILDYYQMEGCS